MDAVDLDGDGDLDILSASNSQRDSKLVWQANQNGAGSFGESRVILQDASSIEAVSAEDFDGDGDLDILLASQQNNSSTIAWLENTDGLGTFADRLISPINSPPVGSIVTADIDDDGDMDFLSTYFRDEKLTWYENTDGRGNFSERSTINTRPGHRNVLAVDVEDFDADGDIDILAAADDRIVWYENTDGTGSFSQQHVITTAAFGVRTVISADIDGDDKLDVLFGSFSDDKIAWYRSTNGQGNFGQQQAITTAGPGAPVTDVADLDGDGDLDLLSASHDSGLIAWYPNNDGRGRFGERQVVANGGSDATSVFAVDLDGDRDLDILWSSFWHTVAWYENVDGQGNFGPQRIISGRTASYDLNWNLLPADIDRRRRRSGRALSLKCVHRIGRRNLLVQK